MKDRTLADINDAQRFLANKNIELYLMYGYLWYEILREIGSTIAKLAVEGNTIELPYNLGHLAVITKDQDISDISKFKIDIIATKQLWKKNPELEKVKYIRYMTDDLTYNSFRWFRNRNSNIVRYIKYYKISMVRSAKRLVAEYGSNGTRYDLNKKKIIE